MKVNRSWQMSICQSKSKKKETTTNEAFLIKDIINIVYS